MDDARELYRLVENTLMNGHAHRQRTACQDTFDPGVKHCWASGHPGAVRRILVWVADATCSPPPFPRGALPWNIALVLLPDGTSARLLPSDLKHQVADWYRSAAIGSKVPGILTAATIGSDAFRLFISYRHEDSKEFAQQLFDALSHQRFDVFLDRFRTPPGNDFLERIRHELLDKACVLTIDSQFVDQSAWVAGENAMALRYKLGQMAVDVPGGQRTFAGIRARLDLQGVDTAANFRKVGLSSAYVDRAVQFVQSHYFAEISRRSRYQRLLVKNAASRAQVVATELADGLFEAKDATGTKDYIVGISARPPATEQFRRTSDAASPHHRKVVVGPVQTQLNAHRLDSEWLGQTSGSALVDERRILKAMQHIHQGLL